MQIAKFLSAILQSNKISGSVLAVPEKFENGIFHSENASNVFC